MIEARRSARRESGQATGRQREAARATWRRLLFRLGVLVTPTVVAVALAAVAMRVHRPTAFDLDLTVSQVSFVSGADRAELLLGKTAFMDLALHGIASATIDAKRVRLAREAGKTGTVPQRFPRPVALSQQRATGASVLFAGAEGGGSALGELDRLFLPAGAGAELAAVPERMPRLSVRIHEQATRLVLSLRGVSEVELLGARIDSGGGASVDSAAFALRLEPDDGGSLVELVGVPGRLNLLLAPAGAVALVANLRVSEIRFQTQGPTGAAVTTVSGDGAIGFPGVPDKARIDVAAGHYVTLREPGDFYLRKLLFQPERGGLRLLAGGTAGSLRSGPLGNVREHALTWFDSVWQQPRSLQLFGLAVWLFPTTLAAYKLFKELRK